MPTSHVHMLHSLLSDLPELYTNQTSSCQNYAAAWRIHHPLIHTSRRCRHQSKGLNTTPFMRTSPESIKILNA